MSDARTNYDFTYAYGALLRFNALLLKVLVGEKLLTQQQAEGLIDELADHIPDTNMFHQVTELLRTEFRK